MSRESDPISPSSLKEKLKYSLRLPWLRHLNRQTSLPVGSSASTSSASPTLTPSPKHSRAMSGAKSPQSNEKCRMRSLMDRIGHPHRRRQSRQSLDCKYDPSSYALNFDEGKCDDWESEVDLFRFRSFSSRLPRSPISTHNSTNRESRLNVKTVS